MSVLSERYTDLKLILTTDKRFWAAGGFVVAVLVVFSATSSWREPEPPLPEEYVTVKAIESVDRVPLLQGLSREIKEAGEERAYLKDRVNRVSEEFASGKQEIDWHVNALVTRLNDMSSKLGDISKKIGTPTIEKAKFEEKMRRGKSKDGIKKRVEWND